MKQPSRSLGIRPRALARHFAAIGIVTAGLLGFTGCAKSSELSALRAEIKDLHAAKHQADRRLADLESEKADLVSVVNHLNDEIVLLRHSKETTPILLGEMHSQMRGLDARAIQDRRALDAVSLDVNLVRSRLGTKADAADLLFLESRVSALESALRRSR